MSNDPRYRVAKGQVDALKGFYIHAIVFGLVMLGLVGLNTVTSANWWVQWPLFGWGVGLLAHAVTVFMPLQFFGSAWEKRKIEERISKL
jgi:2TM domain